MITHSSIHPAHAPIRRAGLAAFSVRALAVVLSLVAALAGPDVSLGQNISTSVAPNINGSDNSVDIENTSGSDWYFYSSPTPAGATMSRISGLTEFAWPSVGNFAPDPGGYEQDRIYPYEYLRVYPNSLAAGTVITVPFASTPVGTQYDFLVTVKAGPQVTALNILDPSPTSAESVRWGVTFSAGVSGVTAANFAFNNPDGMSGFSITSVTPDAAQPSTNWTVTANTGTGTGLLGLNWAGSASETPGVPNSFVGEYYDFSQYPIINQNPASVSINIDSTTTLSVVVAPLRTGGTPTYQWYKGTSTDPGAGTAISGATGSSYTPPEFTSLGSSEYFCEVFNGPGYNTYSTTATITVIEPPVITSSPQNQILATGQTATFSVAATGTSLNYQWYNGVAPDTSNPVGANSTSYTTPALSANSTYWVQVSNPGPTVKNSVTASATVIASLTPSASAYYGEINTAFPTSLAVTARDSANNLVAGLPISFTAPSAAGASGTFPGNAITATPVTSLVGVATAPAFMANSVVGAYSVVANYSTLSVALVASNLPLVTISSPASAGFVTGASNRFTATSTGLPSPLFCATGSLPSGVTFSADGTLAGVPAANSGGVYPITITLANTDGSLIPYTATQNFVLTVVGESVVLAHPRFNTNGVGWTLNGDTLNGGPHVANNVFTPTDGTGGENRSAWFDFPLYVGAFEASFTYQDVSGGGADGTAFVIQNDPRGVTALGAAGGGLGYIGITPSVAVMLNLYSGAPGGGSGLLIATNGQGDGAGYLWPVYQNTAPVNLDAGNPINVSLLYLDGRLQVSLTDTVSGDSFKTNVLVNIPLFVGTNAAWVGITGSEGGVLSHQTVTGFSFTPLPSLSVTSGPNHTGELSWPQPAYGFSLQWSSALTGANWVTMSAAVTQTNNLNQTIVNPGSGSSFYRLMLPP